MPISGVVVKCTPGTEASVAEHARHCAGVEVHAALPDGQVVAVIEGDTVKQGAERAMRLQEIEGVISVQVAYHNFEDATTEQGGGYGIDEA
ncbi:chaperone NapD [Trichlorobacter ammonificans]|uniref:Chaperone NapD n=1 Tax=Trichlorobacter ammonificans TaxID=2916410 RepID=A0ABN8HKR4_9BACT|nr:chaperone NapD [Trichlorobacter ammonificans]CAH2031859.1 Chaperone NapD [Trichlorobacter ammonificans]